MTEQVKVKANEILLLPLEIGGGWMGICVLAFNSERKRGQEGSVSSITLRHRISIRKTYSIFTLYVVSKWEGTRQSLAIYLGHNN